PVHLVPLFDAASVRQACSGYEKTRAGVDARRLADGRPYFSSAEEIGIIEDAAFPSMIDYRLQEFLKPLAAAPGREKCGVNTAQRWILGGDVQHLLLPHRSKTGLAGRVLELDDSHRRSFALAL